MHALIWSVWILGAMFTAGLLIAKAHDEGRKGPITAILAIILSLCIWPMILGAITAIRMQ